MAGLCQLIATVPTGLEGGAADEVQETLGRKAEATRGRINFDIASFEQLKLVHVFIPVDKLRSADNYCVIVKKFPDFCKEDVSVLQRLEQLPFDESCDWNTPLSAWRYYREIIVGKQRTQYTTQMPLGAESTPNSEADDNSSMPSTSNSSEGACSNPSNVVKPDSPSAASATNETPVTFRVTCTRGGGKHSFSSMDAARCFGAGLVRRFGWTVKLKNAELEVLLTIMGESMTVAIALNQESKYKRNIAHFGPTTLRSTIAYGLLRMADIKPGDVVVDPMCGGGSIGIEGTLAWPLSYHLNGDIHKLASPRAKANQTALEETMREGLKMDVLQWDVCSLPMRTSSIDVIVTDLPFGKKSGSRMGNWQLYPQALQEMGRVCRPSTARAVLLTHDNKAFSQILARNALWRKVVTRWINVGGLTAAVYVLHRSSQIYKQSN